MAKWLGRNINSKAIHHRVEEKSSASGRMVTSTLYQSLIKVSLHTCEHESFGLFGCAASLHHCSSVARVM
eukprot:7391825-Prymnesium_polylepis.1